MGALREGTYSARELLALLRWLPQGSAVHSVLMGDETMFGFSREVALLADNYDATMTNMVGTAMGKLRKKPEPYPRPTQKQVRTHTGAKSARAWGEQLAQLLA